jgi:site-specific recombinase XerD
MQRHTVRLLLKNNKKNSRNLYPIYIRITIDRKTSFISTGYYIDKRLWEDRTESVKETHPTAKQINTDITNKKKQVLDGLINASVKGKTTSAKSIKHQTGTNDIFVFADALTKELENKRTGSTRKNWKKHLLKLEAYQGERKLNFEEITPAYLYAFDTWLRANIKTRGEDSNNYIHAIMKTIRKLFNAAKRKGIITSYPFDEYELPEYTPGDKDHLTLSELDKWENKIKQLDGDKKQAAIWFLFGCYTGLRISDWFLFDFKKRVLKDYIRLRAKKNGEWIVVPMYGRLERILELARKTPLTLPEPTLNKTFKLVAKAAKIDKYLSSHSGRKTFAVTMCLERGISSETAAELMGITLATFVSAYSKITPAKIKNETDRAWNELT